jgi:hypothetical protein
MSIIILNEYGLSTKHSNYKTEIEEVAQVVDHLQVQGLGSVPNTTAKKKKKKERVRDGGRDLLHTYAQYYQN